MLKEYYIHKNFEIFLCHKTGMTQFFHTRPFAKQDNSNLSNNQKREVTEYKLKKFTNFKIFQKKNK